MNDQTNGHQDPVAAAIEATEPALQPMVTVDVTISSTGRHVSIAVPPDVSDAELLEFVGWVGTGLRTAAAANRAAKADPASRLVIARGSLPSPD